MAEPKYEVQPPVLFELREARVLGGNCKCNLAALWFQNLPTRTDVFPSSSDALLPPPALLVMLSRLLLRGAGRTIALMGRCGSVPGDDGGEPAISDGLGCRTLYSVDSPRELARNSFRLHGAVGRDEPLRVGTGHYLPLEGVVK